MPRAWLYMREVSKSKLQEQKTALVEFCCKNGYDIAGATEFLGTRPYAKKSMFEAVADAARMQCDAIIAGNIKTFTSNIEEFSDFLIAVNKNGMTLKTADAPEACYENSNLLRFINLDAEPPVMVSTQGELYPEVRELDGMSFRVERDGKIETVCFTDMTDVEQEAVLSNASADELKKICQSLAYSFRRVADFEDIYSRTGMTMKME